MNNNEVFILEEKAELPATCIEYLLHIACDRFFKLIIA